MKKKILLFITFLILILSAFVVTCSAREISGTNMYYINTPLFIEGTYNGLSTGNYSTVDSGPLDVISYNGDMYYYAVGTENGNTITLNLRPSNIGISITDRVYFSFVAYGNFSITCSAVGISGGTNFISYIKTYQVSGSRTVNDIITTSNGTSGVSYNLTSLSVSATIPEGGYLLIKCIGVGNAAAENEFYNNYAIDLSNNDGINYLIYGNSSNYVAKKITNGTSLYDIVNDSRVLNSVVGLNYSDVIFGVNASYYNKPLTYLVNGDYSVTSSTDSTNYVIDTVFLGNANYNLSANQYNLFPIVPTDFVLGLNIIIDSDIYTDILNNNYAASFYYGDVNGSLGTYLNNNAYNNGYNVGINSNNTNSYNKGYNDGYNKGVQITDDIKRTEYENGYNTAVEDLEREYEDTLQETLDRERDSIYNQGMHRGEDIGYADGYEAAVSEFTDPSSSEYLTIYNSGKRVGYAEGYEFGFAAGNSNNTTLEGTISSTISTIPTMVSSMLNFEIFGVNLLAFFGTLIFIGLIAIVIKFVV